MGNCCGQGSDGYEPATGPKRPRELPPASALALETEAYEAYKAVIALENRAPLRLRGPARIVITADMDAAIRRITELDRTAPVEADIGVLNGDDPGEGKTAVVRDTRIVKQVMESAVNNLIPEGYGRVYLLLRSGPRDEYYASLYGPSVDACILDKDLDQVALPWRPFDRAASNARCDEHFARVQELERHVNEVCDELQDLSFEAGIDGRQGEQYILRLRGRFRASKDGVLADPDFTDKQIRAKIDHFLQTGEVLGKHARRV